MSTLYVTQQDAVLRKVDERLKVTKEKETLLDLPMLKVSQVVLFGRVTVTAATVGSLLDHGISLCYLTEHGRYLGRLEPPFSKNCLLRVAQYQAAFDPVRRLALAKQFVAGKLANLRVLLLRANREREDAAITGGVEEIRRAEDRAEAATDLDRLRGHEGEGSAAYFGVLGRLIRQDLPFPGRVRRPPTDPVNSLLSFGYALLANDLHGACHTVGFDPYLGFLHADRYGRPSLALDLMEEFRPLVADSMALTCINKRIIGREDFTVEPGGAHRLNDEGRKRFLIQYDARRQTEFKHPLLGYTITYQRAFEMQARFLAKYLEGELDAYPPLVTK